jgi:hypothetical protein
MLRNNGKKHGTTDAGIKYFHTHILNKGSRNSGYVEKRWKRIKNREMFRNNGQSTADQRQASQDFTRTTYVKKDEFVSMLRSGGKKVQDKETLRNIGQSMAEKKQATQIPYAQPT